MNAYTQSIGFDVLTAPLAEVDRRSLSQAWYSALHLAHDAPPQARARARRAAPALANAAPDPISPGRGEQRTPARAAGTAPPQDARPYGAIERRSQPTSLARKVERAIAGRKHYERLSAFVLDGKRRVHVTVRASGTHVHVVAVCAPQSRARVARALEEARYALARRGVALDARLRESAR
jgi:hypothetical protein